MVPYRKPKIFPQTSICCKTDLGSLNDLSVLANIQIQSNLDRTRSGGQGVGGNKPSNRVVNEAQIREVTIAESQIILYYRPTTFSFTQRAKTWGHFEIVEMHIKETHKRQMCPSFPAMHQILSFLYLLLKRL